MQNQECIRAAYLAHMTPEEKKEYNKKYYQEHKDYWEDYYGRKMGGGNLTGAAKVARDNAVAAAVNKKLSEGAAKRISALEKLESRASKTAELKSKYGPTAFSYPSSGGYQNARTTDLYKKLWPDTRIPADITREDKTGKLYNVYDTPSWKSYETGRSYAGVMTPAVKKSKLSLMTDSAIRKGKSIVSNFASAWKSGLSSIKSAFTPKTTTTLTNLGGGRNYFEKYTALVKGKSR